MVSDFPEGAIWGIPFTSFPPPNKLSKVRLFEKRRIEVRDWRSIVIAKVCRACNRDDGKGTSLTARLYAQHMPHRAGGNRTSNERQGNCNLFQISSIYLLSPVFSMVLISRSSFNRIDALHLSHTSCTISRP